MPVTIISAICLLVGLLFLVAGIYLLTNVNKDETQNKDIPQYIKDHMLVSGITFTSVGFIILVIAILLMTQSNSQEPTIPQKSFMYSKPNLGFKFYN